MRKTLKNRLLIQEYGMVSSVRDKKLYAFHFHKYQIHMKPRGTLPSTRWSDQVIMIFKHILMFGFIVVIQYIINPGGPLNLEERAGTDGIKRNIVMY